MNLLWAVAQDLGSFAVDAFRTLFLPSPKIEAPERVLESRPTYTVLPATAETAGPRSMQRYTPQIEAPRADKDLKKSTVMYTSSLATPLRTAPGALGDAVYTVLPYGSMVMVLDVSDMWAYVASGAYTGWVYIDDLEDMAARVYPSFVIGTEYAENDSTTEKLRALIADEFGAGELSLPLQSEEYVLYRLLRKDIRISWPPIRPRLPGFWHTILKDIASMKVSDHPAVGALMEYGHSDAAHGRGYLAYVEAVFPDGSIHISEVGFRAPGVYEERTLPLSEWQELSPLFLVFS
jgi:hypothetical protein